MEKLAFNAVEAASFLGCSDWFIYRLIREGKLAKLPHLGKKVLVARAELERFAAQGVMDEAS